MNIKNKQLQKNKQNKTKITKNPKLNETTTKGRKEKGPNVAKCSLDWLPNPHHGILSMHLPSKTGKKIR